MIDLGNAFDRAVLTGAGLDPDKVQPGTLTIDMVPTTGPATIRFTMVSTVDSDTLRELIVGAGQPPAPPPSTPTVAAGAAVSTATTAAIKL